MTLPEEPMKAFPFILCFRRPMEDDKNPGRLSVPDGLTHIFCAHKVKDEYDIFNLCSQPQKEEIYAVCDQIAAENLRQYTSIEFSKEGWQRARSQLIDQSDPNNIIYMFVVPPFPVASIADWTVGGTRMHNTMRNPWADRDTYHTFLYPTQHNIDQVDSHDRLAWISCFNITRREMKQYSTFNHTMQVCKYLCSEEGLAWQFSVRDYFAQQLLTEWDLVRYPAGSAPAAANDKVSCWNPHGFRLEQHMLDGRVLIHLSDWPQGILGPDTDTEVIRLAAIEGGLAVSNQLKFDISAAQQSIGRSTGSAELSAPGAVIAPLTGIMTAPLRNKMPKSEFSSFAMARHHAPPPPPAPVSLGPATMAAPKPLMPVPLKGLESQVLTPEDRQDLSTEAMEELAKCRLIDAKVRAGRTQLLTNDEISLLNKFRKVISGEKRELIRLKTGHVHDPLNVLPDFNDDPDHFHHRYGDVEPCTSKSWYLGAPEELVQFNAEDPAYKVTKWGDKHEGFLNFNHLMVYNLNLWEPLKCIVSPAQDFEYRSLKFSMNPMCYFQQLTRSTPAKCRLGDPDMMMKIHQFVVDGGDPLASTEDWTVMFSGTHIRSAIGISLSGGMKDSEKPSHHEYSTPGVYTVDIDKYHMWGHYASPFRIYNVSKPNLATVVNKLGDSSPVKELSKQPCINEADVSQDPFIRCCIALRCFGKPKKNQDYQTIWPADHTEVVGLLWFIGLPALNGRQRFGHFGFDTANCWSDEAEATSRTPDNSYELLFDCAPRETVRTWATSKKGSDDPYIQSMSWE